MSNKVTNSKKPDSSVMTLFKETQNKYQNILKGKIFDGEVSGVVYLGHIPHGFFETEMKAYFTQFGHVTRIKLCRSKKTGESKGYAFIEFKSETVAKIVAETMNNYIMFGKLMKCTFCEVKNLHADTFKGCTRKFKAMARVNSIRRHNKPSNNQAIKTKDKMRKLKNAHIMTLLKKYGIEYNVQKVMENKDVKVVNKKRKLSESTDNEKSTKIVKLDSSPVRKMNANKKVKLTPKVNKTPTKVTKEVNKTPTKVTKEVKQTPVKKEKTPLKKTPTKSDKSPKSAIKAKVETPKQKTPSSTPSKQANVDKTPKKVAKQTPKQKKSAVAFVKKEETKVASPSPKKAAAASSPSHKDLLASPPRVAAPPTKVFTPRTSMRLRKSHANLDLGAVAEEETTSEVALPTPVASLKRKLAKEDEKISQTPTKRLTRKTVRKL